MAQATVIRETGSAEAFGSEQKGLALVHVKEAEADAIQKRGVAEASAVREKLVAEAVGLAEKAGAKPGQLSGGQQQRVAIARALANDPDILLLDEPTGNLDSVAEAEILDLLQRLHRQGKTVIIGTHSDEVAKRAERIIRVKDGLIAA